MKKKKERTLSLIHIYSKKFFEAHRDEITLHKAAKEAFSKLPDGKIPKVKDCLLYTS